MSVKVGKKCDYGKWGRKANPYEKIQKRMGHNNSFYKKNAFMVQLVILTYSIVM